MGKADLHVHTTFSDGVLTPTQLVARARAAGLQAVAITDHDAVEGVPEAMLAGSEHGVLVVPGVEINTDVPGTEVHILGYFLDVDSPRLRESLQGLREGRLRRAERMVERLHENGVPIALERVLAIADGVGAVGRPHVAQAIVELGAAENIGDAFEKYLKPGRPAYVPRQRFTPEEAITAVRDAGGVPVLAHPGASDRDECLREWIRAGLRGLEAEHPQHRPEQMAHYRRLARDLGLIATAGTDFHGPREGAPDLGDYACDLTTVERLRAEADRIRAAAR